jgi:uroporphyrinogen-III synthase
MGFDGLRVLSLESRRAPEMALLIRKQGGEPFVAPSMREVTIEQNEPAFRFAERLSAGDFDMVVLLTGVGTRQLRRVLATRFPEEAFAEALRRTTVVVRGPKPAAAAREMNVPVAAIAPEPNTWRELLRVIDDLPPARHIAVQEYGRSNVEFLTALRTRGAEVTPVRVYEWDLPEDVEPLREAARRMASGEFDVVLFTTAVQLTHLMRIARELGVDDAVTAAFGRMVVASIGPTTSEALEEFGVKPDLEPSHPKMGFLVQETAERAAAILAAKR